MCTVHITVVHTFLLTHLSMYQTILRKGGGEEKAGRKPRTCESISAIVSDSEDTKLHNESFFVGTSEIFLLDLVAVNLTL